jgi:hypothetical protein
MPGNLSPELRSAFARIREARREAREARQRAHKHGCCLHARDKPGRKVAGNSSRKPPPCLAAQDQWDQACAELEEATLALLVMLRLD